MDRQLPELKEVDHKITVIESMEVGWKWGERRGAIRCDSQRLIGRWGKDDTFCLNICFLQNF